MSATNVLIQSDRVHLMTDAAVYQTDGTLAGIGPKVRPMPHISCAVAMRGAYLGWAPIMEEISAAPSFDALRGQAPQLLQACADAYAHLLNHCAAGPEFEVIVAGISETTGPCAYIVASHERYGKPWTVTDLDGFVPLPCDEAILRDVRSVIPAGTGADAIDPEIDGLAVLEIQRATPRLSNGELCRVGGFAQLTTVATDTVTSRILRRWPDAGAPIGDDDAMNLPGCGFGSNGNKNGNGNDRIFEGSAGACSGGSGARPAAAPTCRSQQKHGCR